MAKSSTITEDKFPVIKSLSDYAYKVGEISFPPEWIPEGSYTGVVKELKEKMRGYKIQLVYLPRTDNDMLVYLPPLLLPSGFEATPFPVSLRKPQRNDEAYYLNCGVDKKVEGHDHVYEFDGRGDCQGMWGTKKEERMHYVEQLKKLFESDGSKSICGISAIHLRKVIKELNPAHLEKSRKLFRKHKFDCATKKTSHDWPDRKEFITQWDITNASKNREYMESDDNYKLQASYRFSDKNFKGSPNNISILLYTGGESLLTSNSLTLLEEFSQLF